LNPYRGGDKLPTWWTALRGVPIAAMALPFIPSLMLALAGGNGRLIGGCLAGIAGVVAAMARLRRARRHDARQAGVLLGVGTGLAAAFAGGTGPIGGVVLGLMAWGGARLLYDGVVEMAPPAPPPPPHADGLDPVRARLAALLSGDPRLLPAATAMRGLLDEITLRPAEGTQARRVLMMGVDGLERIAARLARGAAPPETLPALVDDLARAARDAGHGLRATETEALDIQVKVLQDRLRQEGIA
jgi:hypothetical protein